jgi:hypothetical protein
VSYQQTVVAPFLNAMDRFAFGPRLFPFCGARQNVRPRLQFLPDLASLTQSIRQQLPSLCGISNIYKLEASLQRAGGFFFYEDHS